MKLNELYLAKHNSNFWGISDLYKFGIRAPSLLPESMEPAGVYKVLFVCLRLLCKARQAKTYFSVISTETLMDVKRVHQKAVKIPKVFSITLRALE